MASLNVPAAVRAVTGGTSTSTGALQATPAVFNTNSSVTLANGAVVPAQPARSVTVQLPPTIDREAAWLYKAGWPLYALVNKYSTGAPLSDEANCMAVAVYFEARGESLEGQMAVADVIMNRAASGRYPPAGAGSSSSRRNSRSSATASSRLSTPRPMPGRRRRASPGGDRQRDAGAADGRAVVSRRLCRPELAAQPARSRADRSAHLLPRLSSSKLEQGRRSGLARGAFSESALGSPRWRFGLAIIPFTGDTHRARRRAASSYGFSKENPARQRAARGGSRVLRILIVEDDLQLATTLEYLVEDNPRYQVVGLAEDAESAIAAVDDNEPDLVLLDLHLAREAPASPSRSTSTSLACRASW